MLEDAINQDFALLKEKARVRWLRDGDLNSAFYHGNNPPPDQSSFECFEKVISDADNISLCKSPGEEEILQELKDMSDDSAPGPDGFTSRFFVYFWSLIKADIVAAVAANPTGISDLRPISLCNVLHKLLSRILNTRLSLHLHKLVSPEQVGFVKNRSIHENIALAHDMAFDIKRPTYGGNVMVKLDMSKAYDRLSWSIILAALRASGCNEIFVDMVFRSISSP
ncbi:hypothetical protein QQ045_033136 [Rhodiola kirilowii]